MAGIIEQLVEMEQRRALGGYALGGGAAPESVTELERALRAAERECMLAEDQDQQQMSLLEFDMGPQAKPAKGAGVSSEMSSGVLAQLVGRRVKGAKYDPSKHTVTLDNGLKLGFSKYTSAKGDETSVVMHVKTRQGKWKKFPIQSPRDAVKKAKALSLTERAVRTPAGFEPSNKLQQALLALLKRASKAKGPGGWYQLDKLALGGDLQGVPFDKVYYAALALADYGKLATKELGPGKGMAVQLKESLGESLLSEGTYYRQKLRDEELYFKQTGTFKNKNLKGLQVEVPVGSRARKATKTSVFHMDVGRQWKAIPEKDVPKSVMKKFAAVEESEEREAYWSQDVEAIVGALQGAEGVTLSVPGIAEATGLEKALVRQELALMGQAGMVARTAPAGDQWRLTHFGEACGKPHGKKKRKGKTPRMETYEGVSEAKEGGYKAKTPLEKMVGEMVLGQSGMWLTKPQMKAVIAALNKRGIEEPKEGAYDDIAREVGKILSKLMSEAVLGGYRVPSPGELSRRAGGASKSGGLVGRSWDSMEGKKKVVAVKEMGGKQVVLVQTGDRKTGYGIIPVSELEKEIQWDDKMLKSKLKMQDKARKIDAAEKAAKEAAESLDGFEQTLSPAMRGRAIKALTKKGIRHDGDFYKSIRDLIRDLVRQGYKIRGSGRDREFSRGHGLGFLDQKAITKIGMDYAEYLLKHRSQLSKAA